MIKELKYNQIFVFGSNLNGHHYGGAAKQAYEQFGAEWGKGEGLSGQSYAFPTLDSDMNRTSKRVLFDYVLNLLICCDNNQDKEFLLTKVGCGIAGYSEDFMKGLFNNNIFKLPKNLILPIDWK